MGHRVVGHPPLLLPKTREFEKSESARFKGRRGMTCLNACRPLFNEPDSWQLFFSSPSRHGVSRQIEGQLQVELHRNVNGFVGRLVSRVRFVVRPSVEHIRPRSTKHTWINLDNVFFSRWSSKYSVSLYAIGRVIHCCSSSLGRS